MGKVLSFQNHFDDELQCRKKHSSCHSCICAELERIQVAQERKKEDCTFCSLDEPQSTQDTIPILLQTPYGHPFFTWGDIGEPTCFVTIFFKVLSVDCKNQCVKLELLRPNHPLSDCDEAFDPKRVCDIDYVEKTSECITLSLKCFAAVKCLKPILVKD